MPSDHGLGDGPLMDAVGGLYGAASSASDWPSAWAAVAEAFGGISGSLFLDTAQGIQPFAFPGFPDLALRLYAEHFHIGDPWAGIARDQRLRNGAITSFLGQDHVPAARFEESEAWQDFSRLYVGAFHIVGAAIDLGGGSTAMLGLHRAREMGEFDKGDQRRLEFLLPHLRNSLQLARRLATAEAIGQTGFAALNALKVGVAIVDGAGLLVFANRALEDLARDTRVRVLRDGGGPGLGAARPRLSIAASEAQRQLSKLMADAARLGAGGAMGLDPELDGRRLSLIVMPLPRALSTAPRTGFAPPAFAGEFALVIVREATRPAPLSVETLEALYGLTRTEAAVAIGLLGGRTAEDVAAERHVSLPTVRSQIRGILEKTGARGLRDLERIVAAP